MTITYLVSIDIDDDGNFLEAGGYLHADVIDIHFTQGMAAPYESMAVPGQLEVTLNNISQDYSPEVSALALLPGKWIKVIGNDGVANRVLWTGVIERYEPQAGTESPRHATIYAFTQEKQLQQLETRIEPQVDVTADEVLQVFFGPILLRRNNIDDAAILDLVGNAELDSVRLADDVASSFETGVTTFPYVGDTWGDGITIYDAIKQIVEAEHGRFFFNHFGEAIFLNRHRNLNDTTSLATLDDDLLKVDYNFGGDVKNRVVLTMIPRVIGAAMTTLWTNTSSLRLAGGQNREMLARYRDSDKQPCGALVVIPPQPITDFTANTESDGSGIDATPYVNVVLLESDFSAAKIGLVNTLGITLYIRGLTLRGTPLYRDDPLTLEQINYTSSNLYGPKTLKFNNPIISDIDEADQFVRYELARRDDPVGIVRSVEINTVDHPAPILELHLFSRITVNETQTGHAADYFIVGEEHWITLGGTKHRCKWLLEAADTEKFARLNIAELDEGYALAY